MMNGYLVVGTLPLRATARMGFTTKVVVVFEVLSSFFPTAEAVGLFFLLKQWAYFFGLGAVLFEHALPHSHDLLITIFFYTVSGRDVADAINRVSTLRGFQTTEISLSRVSERDVAETTNRVSTRHGCRSR